MILFSSRTMNLLGSLACLLLLITAFYLEYIQNLHPCSLCILQRGAFALLMIVLLLAYLFNPKPLGIKIYGFFTVLIAILGALLAGRQAWLQLQSHAPAEVCMPGFSYILHHLPLSQALTAMLQGSDNCGVVDWTLLGWSMAHWSLLCFILFGLLGIFQILGIYYTKSLSPPK